MGFNIAGIVINNNYDKDISKLATALTWGIEVQEEITFEEASKNWTPDGQFNVYFSEKGTMIFFPHDWAVDQNQPQGVKSLCYAYSATAMTFIFSYLDERGNYRFFLEGENGRQLEEGEPIEQEKAFPTADGLIFEMIDVVLDENWHDYDFGDKAYKCKKIPYSEYKTKLSATSIKEKVTSPIAPIPTDPTTKLVQKKWWEFWK